MKIAIFTDTFYPEVNGVAKTLKRLTDYLDEQKIHFKVFAPKSATDDYVTSQIHRFNSLSFFSIQNVDLLFLIFFTLKMNCLNFPLI